VLELLVSQRKYQKLLLEHFVPDQTLSVKKIAISGDDSTFTDSELSDLSPARVQHSLEDLYSV
jgi:hypothetical protein